MKAQQGIGFHIVDRWWASLQNVLDVEPNCGDIVPLSVSVVMNLLHGGLFSAAKDCSAEVLRMIIELASNSETNPWYKNKAGEQ
jgi:hypothetical protein